MKPPIDIVHLFPELNDKLISFFKSLSPAEWEQHTIARKWRIKDVAAHLLDGNYRRIALNRDGWTVSVAEPASSYSDLVQYLNGLNADWVKAAERLSPRMIIESLESTNEEVYNIFKNLDPFAESVYPVSWAGENKSYNWFDIAREYTERWLHQQQIRDAAGDRELLAEKFYFPFLDIFMRAWPVTMNGKGHEGMVLKTVITGEGGGEWFLKKNNGNWSLSSNVEKNFIAETIIDGNEAWKLFSKSVRKGDIKNKFEIKGDLSLGERVLEMISVMA